jgi:hypothetical protein
VSRRAFLATRELEAVDGRLAAICLGASNNGWWPTSMCQAGGRHAWLHVALLEPRAATDRASSASGGSRPRDGKRRRDRRFGERKEMSVASLQFPT